MTASRNAYNEKKFQADFPVILRTELCKTSTDAIKLKEELGCTLQAINQYKQGHAYPKVENLIKIAHFYNCSLDYLIGLSKVSSPNAEIQAICEYTGLSEKAVSVLHFLCSPREDHDDEAAHKRIIDLLNLVLESSYSAVNKYRKAEEELQHILEARYPDVNIDEAEEFDASQADDTSSDPCTESIENVFTTMYKFIHSQDVSLSFYDGDTRFTVSGEAIANMESPGVDTAFMAKELVKSYLFEKIKTELTDLVKEGK